MKYSTTQAKVLHAIEYRTWEADHRGLTVLQLVTVTKLGETTVRQAVKALEAGGFIHRNTPRPGAGASTRYTAITKQEEQMAERKSNAGRKPDPAVQARDEQVFELIKKAGGNGVTTAVLAGEISAPYGKTYSSICRLKQAKRIVKNGTGTRTPAWVIKT